METVAGDLDTFLTDLKVAVLAEESECSHCEFLAHCGGYFKWPRKDYCLRRQDIVPHLEGCRADLRA